MSCLLQDLKSKELLKGDLCDNGEVEEFAFILNNIYTYIPWEHTNMRDRFSAFLTHPDLY